MPPIIQTSNVYLATTHNTSPTPVFADSPLNAASLTKLCMLVELNTLCLTLKKVRVLRGLFKL